MCRTGPAAAHAAAALAQWLTALRRRSRLSHRRMSVLLAEHGRSVTHTTLWRAEQGTGLPRWPTVEAFVTVCGGDVRHAARLWTAAARGRCCPGCRTPHRAPVRRPLPLVTEPAHLLQAMRGARTTAGEPTLRAMADRHAVADSDVSHLPRSTLHDILSGRRMPTLAQLRRFLQACDTPSADFPAWEAAWRRVTSPSTRPR
ncbi:helix-turn-helix transcriptional regulator [Streptomyces sp. NPDC093224]|uniref:helix-turn-helix domain-containing protein n=1 Tax=Streptomyces sp. NPDC093224 TaxID=3155198 RepID=UPI00344568E0